jgi:transcription initiation factor TFIIB
MGAAAAALYIASIQENERRTQRDVSEAAKVTEVTVRNRYKEFQERLNLEIEI